MKSLKVSVVFSLIRSVFMLRPQIQSIRYLSSKKFRVAAIVEDFGKNFEVPLRECRLHLEDVNAHPHDERIVFIENDHKYIVEGTPIKYSVTSLISEYFGKFESTKIAKGMISGPRWPREGYIHQNGEPYTMEEIIQKWDDNGLDSRNRGTWMHFNIENYLNGINSTASLPEFEQFLQFHRAHIEKKQLQAYRTEWNIFSKQLDLAGAVDFVGQLPDKTFEIIDWKRAKNLEENLVSNHGKKAKPPLQHLGDCDGSKYFLQLNLYRHILESEYGLNISAMTVATFHPDLKTYFAISVPRWEKEVQDVVTDHLEKRNQKVWQKKKKT